MRGNPAIYLWAAALAAASFSASAAVPDAAAVSPPAAASDEAPASTSPCPRYQVDANLYPALMQADPDCDHVAWWIRSGVRTPEDARRWMAVGVTSATVSGFKAAHITIDDAELWHAAGVGAGDITRYMDAKISLETVEGLKNAGYAFNSPAEAQTIIKFQKLGYPQKKIASALAQGFTADDIKDKWIYVGTNQNQAKLYLDITKAYTQTDTITGASSNNATIRFAGIYSGEFVVGVDCLQQMLLYSIALNRPVYLAAMTTNNPDYKVDRKIYKILCRGRS